LSETLLDKYRVESVLGVGGMGAVVAARHLKLDQVVAIKVLLPDKLEEPEFVARFEREARASASIQSDHIVKVTDVGTLDSGTPYLIMERLEGEDLQTLLRLRRSLPIDEALEIVMQTCEVLSEAHALGIVHRDLKPANLFCVPRPDGRPFVKVLDFGISKLMGEELTAVHGLMGSPAYMSPEQIRAAESVDARADIWAIGVVLYEMLTGFVPFNARTLPGILTSIAIQPAPPIRRFRLDVSPGLESVVQKCLEKDPSNRYASANELMDALAPFVRNTSWAPGRGAYEGRASLPAPPSSRSSIPVVFASSRATERHTRSRGATGWLGGALVALAAWVGVLGMPSSAAPASAIGRAGAAEASTRVAVASTRVAVALPALSPLESVASAPLGFEKEPCAPPLAAIDSDAPAPHHPRPGCLGVERE